MTDAKVGAPVTTPAVMVGKEAAPARWLHRFAILMVCLVWPLVWLGGLVTTYDAGMAVPDWPGTYGYNMFLYPVETWLYGPFDLLIEHGHRLLGAVVGLVAIAAVVSAWRSEPRRWVLVLAIVVLVAVSVQGALGGARVVMDARTLAMVHGCFAQAFFGLATALAVVTSRWWWQRAGGAGSLGAVRLGRWARRAVFVLAVCCYLQVVLGAQLRHLHADTSPLGFRHLVETHVAMAVIVWGLSLFLAARMWGCGDLALSRPARWLVGLVVFQIGLGLATWIVNYGLPASTEHWPQHVWPHMSSYVIVSKGYVESLIVTAHVATGSLLFACTVMLAMRAGRVAATTSSSVVPAG